MVHQALEGLAPAALWRHFSALSAIPRPSGHELEAQSYVKSLAEVAGAPWRQDAMGNLVIYLPGGAGPTVAVQTHLDMVCEKDPQVEHDFYRDPIPLMRLGDRVFARGTTLGADNGIGVAAALALLTEKGQRHPPLELIFTVQEETGLHGAMGFDAGLSAAQMLINLDSEDPGTLTVGCAGGCAVQIVVPGTPEATPDGWQGYEISVTGARGGHSGVNIHEPRANAIKVLLGALQAAADPDSRLAALRGGSAHNVIARDAAAVLAMAPPAEAGLYRAIDQLNLRVAEQWAAGEPSLRVSVSPVPAPGQIMAAPYAQKLTELLSRLPHGVLAMSADYPGKVETSANLALLEAGPDSALILASVRSFSSQKQLDARLHIEALGAGAGGSAVVEMDYPGWEPDPGSELAKVAGEQFRLVNGVAPVVEVLHAGLECGVLVAKRQGLEAISLGPFISGAHSPAEHVLASTVERMWALLVGLLGALSR